MTQRMNAEGICTAKNAAQNLEDRDDYIRSRVGSLHDEPVVSELHPRRQQSRVALVQNIMIKMREKCPSRVYPLDVIQRLVQSQMSRMRLDTDAVEYEHIKVLQTVDRLIRDEIKIGGICKIIESICNDRQLSMDDLERRDLKPFADRERCFRVDRVRDQLRQAAAKMNGMKNVLKDPAKIDPRDLIREDRHRTVPKIQRAYVIQAEHVVDVTVCYQNRVEPVDLGTQGLLTKIY